jgi:hypothetical protein
MTPQKIQFGNCILNPLPRLFPSRLVLLPSRVLLTGRACSAGRMSPPLHRPRRNCDEERRGFIAGLTPGEILQQWSGHFVYQEDLRNRTRQNHGSDALQTCQQGHNVLQDRRRPLRITRTPGNHGRCTDADHSGRIADNRDSKRGLVLRPLLLWLLSSRPWRHLGTASAA